MVGAAEFQDRFADLFDDWGDEGESEHKVYAIRPATPVLEVEEHFDVYDLANERTLDYLEDEDELSGGDAGFLRGYLSA